MQNAADLSITAINCIPWFDALQRIRTNTMIPLIVYSMQKVTHDKKHTRSGLYLSPQRFWNESLYAAWIIRNQCFKIFNVLGSRQVAGESTCMSGAVTTAFEWSNAAFCLEFRLLLLDDSTAGLTTLKGTWVTKFDTPNASNPSIIAADFGYHFVSYIYYALQSLVVSLQSNRHFRIVTYKQHSRTIWVINDIIVSYAEQANSG